tara:strand:- start:2571 stop:3434 length:864 start_codon:yes stop_codon:yes gene_type:complete
MNSKSLLSHKNQEPEKGVLYIVGTPIGNLDDISQRAIRTLRNVSLIACEDTRQTKKIINKFKFSSNLISFNKINSYKKIPQIIKTLKRGESVALVSDAGMPIICDPGEDLVSSAKSNEIDIICIPGPCAAITALVSSGMSSSRFIFEGFLPKKKKHRNQILLEISNCDKTIILFESPHRLLSLLEQLKEFCGGDREIQVFRELTKIYEEHIGNNINMAIDFFKGKEVLGEITIVIKGINKPKNLECNKVLLKKELAELTCAGLSLSAASKYLAKKTNLTKGEIYKLH